MRLPGGRRLPAAGRTPDGSSGRRSSAPAREVALIADFELQPLRAVVDRLGLEPAGLRDVELLVLPALRGAPPPGIQGGSEALVWLTAARDTLARLEGGR